MPSYSRKAEEIWKGIPGCEDEYQASTFGRIKSLARDKILKPWALKQTGYLQIDLRAEKRRERCLVHRLILETFVGLCPEGMECRHLDGDKTNNHIENLCWGTGQEQHEDRRKHGTGAEQTARRGEDCSYAKLTEEIVKRIRWLYSTKLFTQNQLAKQFHLHQVTISEIVLRKIWKHI